MKTEGIIYKLEGGDLVYYGSTTEKIYQRIRHHRSQYKDYLEGKRNYQTSYEIIKLGKGKYTITEVERVNFDERIELLKRERWYIENNECINKNRPSRTSEEWREINKDILKQKEKEYKEMNKDKIRQREKEYREKNKETISQKQKEYKRTHKEQIRQHSSEKIICECGGSYSKCHKTTHFKTLKHQSYIKA
jgi:hypothetical protein